MRRACEASLGPGLQNQVEEQSQIQEQAVRPLCRRQEEEPGEVGRRATLPRGCGEGGGEVSDPILDCGGFPG